ncbi:MAG: TraB/GumN family protein [Pseudomonadota bacterium]
MAQETAKLACTGNDLIAVLEPAERDALLAEAAAQPYAEGLLWRATRGDTVIDLFGSYHFRHEQTEAHLARLIPLIDAADTVFLEISNEDQLQMQRDMASNPGLMFITEGPTLPDLLGEDDWQTFSDEMAARGIPPIMAAKFKPLWATLMLGIGPCEARTGGFTGGGIDQRVGEYAKEIGNPSRSLEDFRTLLSLLDELTMDDQIDMIRLSLAWPGNADDLSYTVRQLYLNEQVALTLAFSEYVTRAFGGDAAGQDFDEMMELLLEDRNLNWRNVLRAGISPGDRVFIAVGAGHLPGNLGMLRLLEEDGFTIERLPL